LPEQGCVELPEELQNEVRNLITFNEIPSDCEMRARAVRVAEIATESGADSAMIGGAPYFQRYLEEELLVRGVEPVFAFSKRESVESIQEDGSVQKTFVFRHTGFVRPYQ
jgi:hypothetical protein